MAKYQKSRGCLATELGNDVMEAARLVLNRLELDAEYVLATSDGNFGARKATPFRIGTVRRSGYHVALLGDHEQTPIGRKEEWGRN